MASRRNFVENTSADAGEALVAAFVEIGQRVIPPFGCPKGGVVGKLNDSNPNCGHYQIVPFSVLAISCFGRQPVATTAQPC